MSSEGISHEPPDSIEESEKFDEINPFKDITRIPREIAELSPMSNPTSVDLEGYPPLFTDEEVTERTKLALGELIAIVQLPYKQPVGAALTSEELAARADPLKLFCFRIPEVSGKHVEKTDEMQHQYLIIGYTDLINQIRDKKEAPDNYLILNNIGAAEDIGRERWMPEVGRVHSGATMFSVELANRYSAVSRFHGTFDVGANGQLRFHVEPNTKNNVTNVIHGTNNPNKASTVL